MTTPLAMDNYRPHITVQCATGNVHVYPLRYFEDLVAGKPVEPLPDEVLHAIVHEWMQLAGIVDDV